jgi:hypothetical protein
MKLMKYAVALVLSFLTFTNLCTAQTVYPQCNNLRGIEDSNGNTQLFYRIYSYSVDERYYNTKYDIRRYDTAKNLDTIYLSNSESYSIVGFTDFGFIINGYQFWKNDFSKFIYSWTDYGSDIGANIRRFGEINCKNYAMSYPCRFYISSQNDNLLYTDIGGKSVNGGMTWSADTLFNGHISALSPLSDSVLYFRDTANRLCKTIDRGNSAYVVDSSSALVDTFAFSADGNHIFRVTRYSDTYKFLVSSNAGEPRTWRSYDTSNNNMFISLDDISKHVYVGFGKTIKVYDYEGNLQAEFYSLKKNLIGMYKKPGTNKLYAASLYEIDELTPEGSSVIKQIAVPPDLAQWYPLAKGNMWIYHTYYRGRSGYSSSGYDSMAVVGDTTLLHGKKYFITVSYYDLTNIPTYERYDTLTGNLYRFIDTSEVLINQAYVDLNDTLQQYFMGYSLPSAIFTFENDVSFGALQAKERTFASIGQLPYGNNSRVIKGIGFSYFEDHEDMFYSMEYGLVACRINGVGYGDTTLLGVKDSKINLPGSYSLYQNYPNPFNPSTSITYSIPKAGQVKLNVYSVTGKLVASLVDEYKQAGNYTVNFNAQNLASGVYFYRLSSGSFVENKKMILLK